MLVARELKDEHYGNNMTVPLPASVATTVYVGRGMYDIEKDRDTRSGLVSPLFTALVDLGEKKQDLMTSISRQSSEWAVNLVEPRGTGYVLRYTVPEVANSGYGYFDTGPSFMMCGSCYFYFVEHK